MERLIFLFFLLDFILSKSLLDQADREDVMKDEDMNICSSSLVTGMYFDLGDDVREPKITRSDRECSSWCEGSRGCVGWTRNRKNGVCFIKSSTEQSGAHRDWTLGYCHNQSHIHDQPQEVGDIMKGKLNQFFISVEK